MQCIYRQDLNQYNELLSPNVLLVNHFPLPANTQHISKVNSPALKEVAQTIELLSTSALPMNKLRARYLRKVEEQLSIQQERYDTQRVVTYASASYNSNSNINNSVNGVPQHAPVQSNPTLTASSNNSNNNNMKSANKNNNSNNSKVLSSHQKLLKSTAESGASSKNGKNATGAKFDEKHSR